MYDKVSCCYSGLINKPVLGTPEAPQNKKLKSSIFEKMKGSVSSFGGFWACLLTA